MKLWAKGLETNKAIERFTVGSDPVLDLRLVEFDCVASQAHAAMLVKIGVLKKDEAKVLISELDGIKKAAASGKFIIGPDQEDCHTAIENWLTQKCGEAGKKIHTGRSRNDQVLTALRLYEKDALLKLKEAVIGLIKAILDAGDKYGALPMPGYTHMRKAMPTTVGLWLGGFETSLDDDMMLLDAVANMLDKSPLGSAAGFGVPVLGLDPEMTAKAMGFSGPIENPNYAQISRGKLESSLLHALTQVMFTLNKMATDIMLYSTAEFGFISLPAELCTGSSIMPHKKNADVVELIRGYYHVVVAEEMKVKGLISSLPSGYNRDLQLTKEPVFKALDITFDCLQMMTLVVASMEMDAERMKQAMTPELYATQEAYMLVKQGVPFREAYRTVGKKYAV